jgi:hypothetical protein
MEKKKHQRWKKRDFIVRQKKSKYTNRAAMKKEKAFPRQRKERTFSLHSTTTNHANDETEEKEEHLQTFVTRKIRRQRISTCE